MTNKRKYNINQAPVDKADIDKLKDFDQVLQRVNAPENPEINSKNMAKKGLNLAKKAIIGLALAVGAWFAFKKFGKKNIPEPAPISTARDSTTETKSHIIPPFADLDVPYESFTINSERDTSVRTSKGSTITIKSGTFKTNNSEMVRGLVQLKFREFHNPIDVFRSGIPMTYDSAGTNYTFESGGMFDIRAEKDGVPLRSEFAEPLEVDLVASTSDNSFNSYFFDDSVGQWSFMEKAKFQEPEMADLAKKENKVKDSTPVKRPADDLILVDLDKSLIAKPQMPKFPKLINDKYSFNIDFNQKNFPELHPKCVFQVDESLSKFSAAYYDVAWDKIELKRSKIKNRYTVFLSKGETKLAIETYPALSAKDLKLIKDKYNRDLEKYNAYMRKLQSNASAQRVITKPSVTSQILRNTKTKRFTNKKIRWKLIVRQPGTYNCDRPIPPKYSFQYLGERAPTVKASFAIDNKIVKQAYPFNVVEGINMILSEPKRNEIAYSKKKKNVMWIVKGDKIAIADPEDFKNIRKGAHTFNMDELPASEALVKLKDMLELE